MIVDRILKASGWLAFLVLATPMVLTAVLPGGEPVLWTAIDVSGNSSSGDAHLIEYPNGENFLIDTGFDRFFDDSLWPALASRRINRLDGVLITHAHRNHYGALLRLADRVTIGAVYFNPVAPDICDRESWSSGCRSGHVEHVRSALADRGIPVHTVGAGDELFVDLRRGIRHEVLAAFDGVDTPVGRTDVNDTSVISRLSYGEQSILFSGDVNNRIGRYLAKHAPLPSSTVMTAPHHGVESAAPNSFLDMVGPSAAIATINQSDWLGKRGDRMRSYFSDHGIPVYVSGVHGTFSIELRPSRFEVIIPTAAVDSAGNGG
ncbi:MAG: MBL fold metallo-hydrolase [Proteobacteria bacterium]|nr:MAG: MBL fold metallo-hydrolase [Pseudomonadota bacterium]